RRLGGESGRGDRGEGDDDLGRQLDVIPDPAAHLGQGRSRGGALGCRILRLAPVFGAGRTCLDRALVRAVGAAVLIGGARVVGRLPAIGRLGRRVVAPGPVIALGVGGRPCARW